MYVINTDEKDPHHLSDQIIIYQTFKTITFSQWYQVMHCKTNTFYV